MTIAVDLGRKATLQTKYAVGIALHFTVSMYILYAVSIALRFTIYVSLTADPGVGSLIPALSRTFVEIDDEIITVIPSPSTESFKNGLCQLQAKVCAQSTG